MGYWRDVLGRGAAVLAMAAMLAAATHRAGALTRDDFQAPSFRATSTLSGRVPQLNWDRQEEIAAIVREGLRSSDGWRPHGAGTATNVKDRRPSQRSATGHPAPAGSAPVEKMQRSRRAAVADAGARPIWEAPRAEDFPAADVGAKTQANTPEAKPAATKPAASNNNAAGRPKRRTSTVRMGPDVAPPNPSAEVASPKLPRLSRQQVQLRNKVRRVLAHYYNRPLHTGNRGPWEVMHAMLGFEVHSRVRQGGPSGEPITAVGWLCFNQPCRKRTLMYLNNEGELRVRVGPALQGHEGQLLALLAQARVQSDYPMKVDGEDLTIADLIKLEKKTCYPNTELTFKLIGLMHYLEPDATWLNDQGLEWDMRRLVREELAQPVRGAACGGTHRLSGLTLAYKKLERLGLPVDGEFAQARQFVRNYQRYAYRLQNPDGSFSTEWFRGPGREEDLDRRLQTTGHILEWLLYAADEAELTHWRTVKATNYLANIMWAGRHRDWEAGPLGHAIHALVLYDRLAFSKYDEQPELPVAEKVGRNRR